MDPSMGNTTQESHEDVVVRRFVHELDSLQRQRPSGVALEEIVAAMSPTGVTAAGVAEILRGVYYDGIASWGTSPNPADYNRPLIHVWLNREHPVVRAALAGDPLPKDEPRTQPLDIKFPIGTIDGEPPSKTIIRER